MLFTNLINVVPVSSIAACTAVASTPTIAMKRAFVGRLPCWIPVDCGALRFHGALLSNSATQQLHHFIVQQYNLVVLSLKTQARSMSWSACGVARESRAKPNWVQSWLQSKTEFLTLCFCLLMPFAWGSFAIAIICIWVSFTPLRWRYHVFVSFNLGVPWIFAEHGTCLLC